MSFGERPPLSVAYPATNSILHRLVQEDGSVSRAESLINEFNSPSKTMIISTIPKRHRRNFQFRRKKTSLLEFSNEDRDFYLRFGVWKSICGSLFPVIQRFKSGLAINPPLYVFATSSSLATSLAIYFSPLLTSVRLVTSVVNSGLI